MGPITTASCWDAHVCRMLGFLNSRSKTSKVSVWLEGRVKTHTSCWKESQKRRKYVTLNRSSNVFTNGATSLNTWFNYISISFGLASLAVEVAQTWFNLQQIVQETKRSCLRGKRCVLVLPTNRMSAQLHGKGPAAANIWPGSMIHPGVTEAFRWITCNHRKHTSAHLRLTAAAKWEGIRDKSHLKKQKTAHLPATLKCRPADIRGEKGNNK